MDCGCLNTTEHLLCFVFCLNHFISCNSLLSTIFVFAQICPLYLSSDENLSPYYNDILVLNGLLKLEMQSILNQEGLILFQFYVNRRNIFCLLYLVVP